MRARLEDRARAQAPPGVQAPVRPGAQVRADTPDLAQVLSPADC
ncbi:MAG: hypothetical protein AB1700_18520 [Bacillota bacterium]